MFGRHVVARVPDGHFYLRPGESHLGTLGVAEEILGMLLESWDRRTPGRRDRAQ